MTGRTSFRAPWSALLVFMSLLSVAIVLGTGVLFAILFPRELLGGLLFKLLLSVLAGVLLGSALFTIRGYELAPAELLVERLLWATRLPLADLRAAWADPTAMRWSWRLFGNGGMFAISGLFWNRRLGRYRAFATDPRNAVVLRFATRTVVVTPDAPRELLDTLALYCPGAKIDGTLPLSRSAWPQPMRRRGRSAEGC
jgi:PH (Pleckstrin Homology) domain-containing protein